MAENERADEGLHEVAWQWAGRIVVAAVLIGAGLFAAYMKWGNAPELRAQVDKQQTEVARLEKILETVQTKIDRTTKDKEACQRELEELRKQ